MPEYLSPGVYVEEIDTGSKPIEGVSTSTAGMVGCCERGPLVPVLVTSFGEFQRLYGGLLSVPEFTDGAGGAIIVWADERWGTADVDIYAQRIDGSGSPLWAANGAPVCTASSTTSPLNRRHQELRMSTAR